MLPNTGGPARNGRTVCWTTNEIGNTGNGGDGGTNIGVMVQMGL